MMKSYLSIALCLLIAACGNNESDPATAQPSTAADTEKKSPNGDPADLALKAGQKAFRKCAACHIAADPQSPKGKIAMIGPNLFDIYGAEPARLPDYSYSKALLALEATWTDETLNAFLEKPQAYAPGNRMSFPGERDAQTRAAIIAYLKSKSPNAPAEPDLNEPDLTDPKY